VGGWRGERLQHISLPLEYITDVLGFSSSFVRVFFAAFLPPMLIDGVGFEPHPQNTLARFSLNTEPPRILGFVIRDFGGIRVHPETLRKSTGIELASYAVPGHSVIADTIEDVYVRMYHTVFHNHFQQLIRVLGLHYSGKGWDIVRKCLREQVPTGHPLEKAWLGEDVRTVPGKCFMRMRMAGAYRFVSVSLLSFDLS
jgi:siderophore synthetase component